MKVIYLDNNATTQVAPEVLSSMLPFLQKHYGNPSSMHFFGGKIAQHIKHAREQVAYLLNASPDEIIFTSCGTESDNMAIRGTLELIEDSKKNHIITTAVEHPAVKNTMSYLEKKGYKVTYLKVNRDGLIDLNELKESITEDTVLVSIMYANNETGVIFPIEEIGKIIKEKNENIIFHVDAVQVIGKIDIDLKKSTIDLLALSGHKFHAPKGIGALYIRKGVKVAPLIIGGHQEKGLRAGTEAVPNIIGLGTASELAKKNIEEENKKVKALRDELENWILNNIPDTILNGHKEKRLPNTTNIGFQYIEGEAILLSLSKEGICASSGSACSSGSLEPSHVLKAMGIPYTAIHGSIRFSLSRYNTKEDIEYVKEKLPPIVEKLRKLSPFIKK